MNDGEGYDIALSFAGEDRDYVRAVAEELRANGVKVFFDEYKQVDLWGKDLYEHLHFVYSSRAKYCVVFISDAYARKIWTTHERRSAQERALNERREYILPARFDSTEIPGLSSTVGYINLKNYSPKEFAQVILEKLGRTKEDSIEIKTGFRVPRSASPPFDPYKEGERFMEFLAEELSNRSSTLKAANAYLSIHSRGERKCFRVLRDNRVLFSMDIWMGGISGDKGLSFYAINGEIRSPSNSVNAWADMVWDQTDGHVVLEFHDMSLFGNLPGVEMKLVFSEFADRIWDRIVDVVEGSM